VTIQGNQGILGYTERRFIIGSIWAVGVDVIGEVEEF